MELSFIKNQISKRETTLIQYHLKTIIDSSSQFIKLHLIGRWETTTARGCTKLQCNAKCFKILIILCTLSLCAKITPIKLNLYTHCVNEHSYKFVYFVTINRRISQKEFLFSNWQFFNGMSSQVCNFDFESI